MADKSITDISDAEFPDALTGTDKPVLVDFWAPWCGPCQMLGPMIEEISGEMSSDAVFHKMNVDENPETAGKFGIMSIPTVLIFKNGEIKESFVGVQSKDTYVNAIKNHSA